MGSGGEEEGVRLALGRCGEGLAVREGVKEDEALAGAVKEALREGRGEALGQALALGQSEALGEAEWLLLRGGEAEGGRLGEGERVGVGEGVLPPPPPGLPLLVAQALALRLMLPEGEGVGEEVEEGEGALGVAQGEADLVGSR